MVPVLVGYPRLLASLRAIEPAAGRDLIFTDLYPMSGHGLDEQRPPTQIFHRLANGARPENVGDPCRSVYAKYSLHALQIH